MNKHKQKCDKLKQVRKDIADKIGVDLHQKECTFSGDCTGTCPKCKQEEEILIELPRCRASRILYVYRSPINYKELEFINLPLALF